MNDMNGAADHAPVANGVINGGMSLPTGEAEDYQHPMDAEEVSLDLSRALACGTCSPRAQPMICAPCMQRSIMCC